MTLQPSHTQLQGVPVLLSWRAVRAFGHLHGGEELPDAERDPNFRAWLRNGLVEGVLKTPDGKLHALPYKANRARILLDKLYSPDEPGLAGEVIPDAHLLTNFRQLLRLERIRPLMLPAELLRAGYTLASPAVVAQVVVTHAGAPVGGGAVRLEASSGDMRLGGGDDDEAVTAVLLREAEEHAAAAALFQATMPTAKRKKGA